MLCRRRIASTILLLMLGLALLGQPSALSRPKDPSQLPASAAAHDPAAPVTTDTTFVTPTTAPATDVTTAVVDAPAEGAPEDVAAPGLGANHPGPHASPTPSPSPTDPPVDPPVDTDGLTVTSSASKMLTQVGGRLAYRLNVANEGTDTLSGVTLVSIIPDELDASGVQIPDSVEAAFHGSSLDSEDIVWVLKDLAPGAEVVLPWRATAVSRGDLRAVTSTRVKMGDVRVDNAETTTYLATAGKRAPHNPTPTVKKRVVTFESVPVPAEEQPSFTGAPATGSPLGTAADPLPLTGSDPKPLVIAGLLLVAFGLLLALRPARYDRRKLLIVALLVLTACVDSTSDEASGPSTTVEDEVKGTRFGRNNNDNGNGNGNNGPAEGPATTTTLPFAPVDEPGDSGTTDTTAVTGGATTPTLVTDVPAETVTTLVRHVGFEIVPADLETAELESRDGDNFVTVDWIEGDRIAAAASSTFFQKDAPVEIQSTVEDRNGALHMDVTLTNIQESTKLIVKGNLVHTITGADGSKVAVVRSDPYDLELNPGGTVQAHFSYLLPTGSYSMTSAFEAD